MMLEELQRRNYAQSTVKGYLRIVQDFAQHFHQPPDKLGPDHLCQYQAHLFQEKKLNAGTVQQYVAALRFFFNKTLKRRYPLDDIPMPKRHRKLPEILSPDEVALLIASASNLFHQTMLMTLYATGMRRAELCNLKTTDIDSQRMMVHICQGKGGRDRNVPLSDKLLQTLRIYWRWMKPKTYLFPGTVNNWRADVPINTKVPWEACRQAAQRAGITKHVSPHTIRHASAYYTTFPTPFILKAIGFGRVRFAAVYGPGGPLSPVAARPAMTSPSGRLSTEHTLPHALPVEYVLG